jgi:tetratricopeptide (TPR) repeat protein
LRRAIGLSDKHFFAHYDLGRLLVKQNRYEESLPLLQRAASLKLNHPDVHYQLFRAYARLKRKEEAERELTLFKKLDEERKRREKEGHTEQEDYIRNSILPPAAPVNNSIPKTP